MRKYKFVQKKVCVATAKLPMLYRVMCAPDIQKCIDRFTSAVRADIGETSEIEVTLDRFHSVLYAYILDDVECYHAE